MVSLSDEIDDQGNARTDEHAPGEIDRRDAERKSLQGSKIGEIIGAICYQTEECSGEDCLSPGTCFE